MSTFYHSTRSNGATITSKETIRVGLAPDGGLFVCDEVGSTKLDLDQVCGQGFHENACLVLKTLLNDYSFDEIATCVERAYGEQWDSAAVCPVTCLGDDWLLELYHGPTSAFKDVALQMLPQLMSVARADTNENVMIVTATSGDTGKAALAGFSGVKGCGVCVLYPEGKVSDIQYLQMATQPGDNVDVVAIEGTFDDAQTAVKRTFGDEAVAERLLAHGIRLSSANSINVGRLAPQVTYYFDSYAQLVRNGAVRQGDPVDFCVPTGNFGDVLAGYYAKRMGLPVGKLIVASNSNDVLYDFLTTGTYDRRRPFHKTISPSMDILVSSNLERLLYYASNGNCELVASLMDDLANKGYYVVPSDVMDTIRETFVCGRANDEQTAQTIRSTWEKLHVLIDPHTAVAKHVLDEMPSEGRVRVCLSTASPYKFGADVLAALGEDTDGLDGFGCMDALQKLTGTVAPAQLSALREAEVRFDKVVSPDDVKAAIESSAVAILDGE